MEQKIMEPPDSPKSRILPSFPGSGPSRDLDKVSARFVSADAQVAVKKPLAPQCGFHEIKPEQRESTVQSLPGRRFLWFALLFFFSILGAKSSFAQMPSITSQPASQTVTAGQSATFTVTVANGPCRSYWFINGAGYYGAFASTISYTIPNATLAMNGWKVYVNLYGCGTAGANLGNSQTAVLTVTSTQTSSGGPTGTGAPTITTQPASLAVTSGQTATFTVVATGTAPLSYQWQKNGASIAGAITASYTTPATTTADSGATFRVMVSDSVGSVPSNAAPLTVNAT